jgi:hypothetical protein
MQMDYDVGDAMTLRRHITCFALLCSVLQVAPLELQTPAHGMVMSKDLKLARGVHPRNTIILLEMSGVARLPFTSLVVTFFGLAEPTTAQHGNNYRPYRSTSIVKVMGIRLGKHFGQ